MKISILVLWFNEQTLLLTGSDRSQLQKGFKPSSKHLFPLCMERYCRSVRKEVHLAEGAASAFHGLHRL